jgi:cytochrome c biogenesis protein CcdA
MEKQGQYRRTNNTGTLWFIVHLIVGLYFINLGFNFIDLGFADAIKNYITIAGGVLIIVAGFMAMRRTPYSPMPYR